MINKNCIKWWIKLEKNEYIKMYIKISYKLKWVIMFLVIVIKISKLKLI